jgi:4-aminobutyrate aminotransferase
MRKSPQIKTALPGPRIYPLVVKKARGMWVHDVDGNVFLDFTAGIAVNATGHCHPGVVNAIKLQADKLLHMSGTDFYYTSQIALAEKLALLAAGNEGKRVYFGNSGAEAVEAAFKLARWHTKRELNLAFFGAFHGRTMGALSLTASKTVQKKHYNPFVPGITHIPYPYCYRCAYNLCYPECGIACVHWVEDTLFRTTIPPEEVAAIFIEPIQGEGGYVVPPPEFHKEMHKVAQKYGILYVADEVQSGMGRTGKMFAMEHFGVNPDMMAVAKVSCQAAMKTIELLEQDLLANAATQGAYLMTGLRGLQKKYECMGDVRGKGLMVGVELVKDRESKEPARIWRTKVVKAAFKRGLLLLGCGENSIRFCPSLTVTPAEIDECLSIFDEAIQEVVVDQSSK